jgi:TolB protein
MVTGDFYSANEAYFSPDGKYLIMQARKDTTEAQYHTYVVSVDGKEARRINDKGSDACSYFFPDGKRLIWTSTKDNLHLETGNFASPQEYPAGAELYVSDLNGGNVVRLTQNESYDAEVSVSPDGQWVLFGRRTGDSMDLWRMRPDGSEAFQITHTPDLQEGGAFYMPDSKTILYRAWEKKDEGGRGMPMTIYTIHHDGTGLRQITTDPGTNWAPYPSPDGKHFVYVRMIGQGNFEVFLMNIETGRKVQVTNHTAFDGYPSFAPDGKTIAFASSRDMPRGARRLAIYTMDISALLQEK